MTTTTTTAPTARTARQMEGLRRHASGERTSAIEADMGCCLSTLTRSGRNTLNRKAMKVRFGVEIEYTGAFRSEVTEAIQAAGIDARMEGYNHTTRPHVKVISDATVTGSSDGFGGEVVLPPVAGEAGFQMIRTVVEAIKSVGGKVDRSCGLHVHIDMKGLTGEGVARFAEALYNAQPMLRAFVPATRATNQWCSPTGRYTVERFAEQARSGMLRRGVGGESSERYHAVNVMAFGRHGTIEVRLHTGSLNADKIINWVSLILSIRSAVEAEVDTWLVDTIDDGGFGRQPAAENGHHVADPKPALRFLTRFAGLNADVAEALAVRSEQFAR